MKVFNKTLLALAVSAVSVQATAAGFQLNSQSATGLGRAFAGDAVIADNASVLSRNPAAMALFDQKSLSLGLAVADVTVEAKGVNFTSTTGNLTNYHNIDNAAEVNYIPNMYYIYPIDDKVAIGFAAFSNFGTGTDFTELTPITGKTIPADLIGETAVTTMNFNTSISYRINEQLSIGAGLDLIYGQGTLNRAGHVAIIPNYLEVSQTADVDADGFGFGGILGATYEFNANNRIGLSYRFSPDMKVEGTVNSFDIKSFKMVERSNLTVPLADIAQFAGFHQLTPKFALSYTVQWTGWGNFDTIDYETVDGITEELKAYHWDDSIFASLAGTYQLNDTWTLRAGYGYDHGVVGDHDSVAIPDSDRQWFSFGATYKLSPKANIDFGYSRVQGTSVSVTENSLEITPDLALGGTLHATTKSTANYFGIQYSRTF